MSKIIMVLPSGSSFSQARGSWSMTCEHNNNRQWKVVSQPTSGEAVVCFSIRSVQSLWPHIALVIHESALRQCIMAITACSQHRVIGYLWRMQ